MPTTGWTWTRSPRCGRRVWCCSQAAALYGDQHAHARKPEQTVSLGVILRDGRREGLRGGGWLRHRVMAQQQLNEIKISQLEAALLELKAANSRITTECAQCPAGLTWQKFLARAAAATV